MAIRHNFVRMNVASPGHELNPGHLVYQKDVSNPPSKSRLEGDETKDGGGLWSTHDSTNASLSAGNQTPISDGVSLREVTSQYFQAGINTEWTDVLLIISGFVSGLVDGLSFNSWGSFSSMQTGASIHAWFNASVYTDRTHVLTEHREHCIHSPRCLRPTHQPTLPLGQIPHLPRRLPDQQPFLHLRISRPPPPPPLNTRPFFRHPNSRHPSCSAPRPTRRCRLQT